MLLRSLSLCVCRPVYALLLGAALLAPLAAPGAEGQSLIGSKASLHRQGEAARLHGYSYLRNAIQVEDFVDRGLLVRVKNTSDLWLVGATFPYARPEVKLFLERLSEQYRDACGERLGVTSLTRPMNHQPRNASSLSVHPTGMAMDLRRSHRASCRKWIESTLLLLEGRNVLEATRERHPPHYHVTLFPEPYTRYLAGQPTGEVRVAKAAARSSSKASPAVSSSKRYRVSRGDNLWKIAQKHGTSVGSLKRYNGLRSNRLKPGQLLRIPVTAR